MRSFDLDFSTKYCLHEADSQVDDDIATALRSCPAFASTSISAKKLAEQVVKQIRGVETEIKG
jgi:hypothetical protein